MKNNYVGWMININGNPKKFHISETSDAIATLYRAADTLGFIAVKEETGENKLSIKFPNRITNAQKEAVLALAAEWCNIPTIELVQVPKAYQPCDDFNHLIEQMDTDRIIETETNQSLWVESELFEQIKKMESDIKKNNIQNIEHTKRYQKLNQALLVFGLEFKQETFDMWYEWWNQYLTSMDVDEKRIYEAARKKKNISYLRNIRPSGTYQKKVAIKQNTIKK